MDPGDANGAFPFDVELDGADLFGVDALQVCCVSRMHLRCGARVRVALILIVWCVWLRSGNTAGYVVMAAAQCIRHCFRRKPISTFTSAPSKRALVAPVTPPRSTFAIPTANASATTTTTAAAAPTATADRKRK